MKRRIVGVGVLALGCTLALSSAAADRVSAASAAQTVPAESARSEDAECMTCHGAGSSKPAVSISRTRHGNKNDSRTPACRDCHGASENHIKAPSSAPDVAFGAKSKAVSNSEQRSAACLTCHESKVLARANWAGSQHQTRGVACSDCHNVHAPDQKVLSKATQAEVCFGCHKEQRAQMRRVSTHPLATTALATLEDGVLGLPQPARLDRAETLVKNSVNDTCLTCHAEKRGPYLWEHAPVADDCTNCHTPHGSTTRRSSRRACRSLSGLSQWRPRRAGQQRREPGRRVVSRRSTARSSPGAAAPRAQMAARACLNCHVLIHGSNHPAGAKFQR